MIRLASIPWRHRHRTETAAPGIADPPRWTRPGWLAGGVVVLVAVTVLVTWLLVGVAHVGRDGARAGTIYRTDFVGGTFDRHATVQLPSGALRVEWTAALDRLPSTVASSVHGPQFPPDGGSWIGVRVDSPPRPSDVQLRFGIPSTPALLSVVAGGHTYPLAAPAEAGLYCPGGCVRPDGRAFVAVPGNGTDVRIAVAYGGVTQLVHLDTGRVDRGRAAALYRTQSVRSPSCGTPVASTGFTVGSTPCSVATARLPYVQGLGWAPTGSDWTVVVVAVDRPYSVSHLEQGQRRSYITNAFETTVSLNSDAGPTVVSPHSTPAVPLASGEGQEWVIRTPAATASPRLTVSARYGLTGERIPSPASTMSLTWTVNA